MKRWGDFSGGLLGGVGLALGQVPLALIFEHVAVLAAVSGLWTVFAALLIGRFSRSPRVAVAIVCGVATGVGGTFFAVLLALGRSNLLYLPQVGLVAVAHGAVGVAGAFATGMAGQHHRWAGVWTGLAAGLLGGITALLWGSGSTSHGVLVIGLVLTLVALAALTRRISHLLVSAPLAVVIAVAAAPVYAAVPGLIAVLWPVQAG
ncbi:hypothetical protein GCM10010185_09010 [Saccharothrix coeruleofusca]|uniref:Uncharacterized protein n=1 Tax=Saccharothrix coeruleofusca TaxID=33919 RepID=A0A918AHV7_9PSEU|nr:hypothetical protein GCM10010185_09010 [Saccharothrix coeruleofusca]